MAPLCVFLNSESGSTISGWQDREHTREYICESHQIFDFAKSIDKVKATVSAIVRHQRTQSLIIALKMKEIGKGPRKWLHHRIVHHSSLHRIDLFILA